MCVCVCLEMGIRGFLRVIWLYLFERDNFRVGGELFVVGIREIEIKIGFRYFIDLYNLYF